MRLCAAIFMYITALTTQVATQGADVTETCEPFVENSDSRCACIINTTAVRKNAGKCGSTVGYVQLVFVEEKGSKVFCTFSDYFLGLIQDTTDDPRFVRCGKVNDGNLDFVTLELWLRTYEPAFVGSDFTCKLNCVGGGTGLKSSSSGTHIAYSPDCRPGITGEKCNGTCPSDCVGGVCGRELGNCTRITPNKKSNMLAIGLGVGVPGLAALVSWLCWFCGQTSTALSMLEFFGCGSSSRNSDKSSDSDEDDEDKKPAKKDRRSLADVAVGIETEETEKDPGDSLDSAASSQSLASSSTDMSDSQTD